MNASPAGSDGSALGLFHISKRFGRVSAIQDVSLDVRRGTVHALVGENGAGKTTLMRIAFGLLAADEGTLTIGGTSRRISSAADAIRCGLGMVHQHFTHVPEMTVAENVALGGRGWFDVRAAGRRVTEIGVSSGLVLDPTARAAELSVGAQQRLEIVKALARNATTLILDEPTAVLAPAETAELLQWLRRFADDGHAVVLITHKLHEALSIGDEVTVLRRGRVVLSAPTTAHSVETLATALLGDELPPIPTSRVTPSLGMAVVSARDIEASASSGRGGIRPASFEIRAGEIVGLAGVEGAGHFELLRVIAGRRQANGGALTLPSSIGFVPEDRHRDAVVLRFSLAENVALKGAEERHGRLPMGAIRRRTGELLVAADVRGGDANTLLRALSGGNQQKLVLARELADEPALLVVENPTRGLDIRAGHAVRDRLRAAAEAGAAVVVYSSDIDEVLSLATRVFAVFDGRVRQCPLDRESIGQAVLGLR